MDEAAIKKSLLELNQSISTMPVAAGQRVAGGIYQAQEPEVNLEGSLELLRLQVKYLLFDIEATRRENRYLRQLLENRPQPPKEDPSQGF